MKTVSVLVRSDKKSPRLELFVRIIWAIPTAFVLWIYGLLSGICLVIQLVFILITGKRNIALNDVIRGYFYYSTKVRAYLGLITDERNPILPED
jgi:hypothetical protein